MMKMTAKQYQAAIDRLGLSQVAAAELLGLDPRTSRRYALGEIAVPAPTAKLLRLLLAGKISAEDVRAA